MHRLFDSPIGVYLCVTSSTSHDEEEGMLFSRCVPEHQGVLISRMSDIDLTRCDRTTTGYQEWIGSHRIRSDARNPQQRLPVCFLLCERISSVHTRARVQPSESEMWPRAFHAPG
jgi:hypothetical protein